MASGSPSIHGARGARVGPTVALGGAVLAGFAAAAVLAPLLVGDPAAIDPANRLKFVTAAHWFGTDYLGRDIFARAVYGARSSLIVGFAVAAVASVAGLALGVLTGYFRAADRLVMPFMDGLMAIPGILLAIALVSLLGASLATVVVAIAVPEMPRMVRIVRGVVLSVREQPYVAAAISIATPTPLLLWRHVVPNTVGAVTVQATYACASAIIAEAVLSFLGVAGSAVPSWGGMIAESRSYVQIAPWLIGFPGLLLSILVLAVNLLGDRLRDLLDPRIARRAGR